MDKQMIEEMARIIAFVLCPKRNLHIRWGDKAQCYSDNNFAECTQIKNVVDKLYNAGYRKIPENAVVLTSDELKIYNENIEHDREKIIDLRLDKHELMNEISEKDNKIALLEETIECIKFNVYVTRKETAEKFAELLKIEFKEEDFWCDFVAWKIDEIAKEITEGEKEISNETV